MTYTPADRPIATAGTTDWRLTQSLRRWRASFVVAALVTAALVVADFVFTRIATERLALSGSVLWTASRAQTSAWRTATAVRDFSLRDSAGAPARAGRELAIVLGGLDTLRTRTAGNPEQRLRIDSLATALHRWDSLFVSVVVGGTRLTRAAGDDANDANDAFDEVSRHFDAFIAWQTAARGRAVALLRTTSLAGAAVILLSLAVTSRGDISR